MLTVKGVSAEAELLGAMVGVFKSLGLGARDVGIRVNSRKVLGGLLLSAGVPSARFAEVCVVVDKLDKIGAVAVEESSHDVILSNTTVSSHDVT